MLYEVHVSVVLKNRGRRRHPVRRIFAVIANDAHQAQEMVTSLLRDAIDVDASTIRFSRIDVHQNSIFRCPL